MTSFFINHVAQIISVKGDDLFFFGNDHALKRFSLEDKKLLWSTPADTQYVMLEDDEFIYPYRDYHCLHKLNKSDGSVVFRLEKAFCPVKLVNGVIYGEVNENNEFWSAKIDTASFTIEKTIKLFDKQLIFVEDGKGLLKKGHDLALISMTTANIYWELDLNAFQNSPLSVMLFVGYANGHAVFHVSEAIIGVDLAIGRIKWTFPKKVQTTSPILDQDGTLYFITSEMDCCLFHKIDVATGEFLLRKELPSDWNAMYSFQFTMPAIHNRFFAMTSARRLAKAPFHSIIIFDRDSGNPVQSIKLEGTDSAVTTAPHFTDTMLLQLDGEGKIHVFENYSDA
jgi:hypothetical protein